MARVKKQPIKEIEAEVIEEVRAQAGEGALIVYAEFDEYKVGDLFVMPEGWRRDDEYTELLYTKAKKREGICFMRPDGNRATLPVKEI